MTNPLTVAVEALEKIATFQKAVPGGDPGSYQRGYDNGFNNAGSFASGLAAQALATLKTAQEEQAPSRPSQKAGLREALNKVWTLKHVYDAQLTEHDCELDAEDAALVAGIVDDIRAALHPPTGHEGKGDYMCTCHMCKAVFLDDNKRAVTCPKCKTAKPAISEEEIARIIEPQLWTWVDEGKRPARSQRIQDSLTKARAIFAKLSAAAPSQPLSEGGQA